MLYNLFEYLPKKRMPTAEDPHLKVPYFHNYLSLLSHPEMWQKVWDLEKIKQGPEVFLPDDLPPMSFNSPMSAVPSGMLHRQGSTMFTNSSHYSPQSPMSSTSEQGSLLNRRAISTMHLNTGHEQSGLARTDSMLTKTRSMTKLLHWDEYLN
ncbi:hypothetical protein GEMRC1_007398 [Eukaryota sp. GEM-RC1]